jgi:hypothetical protein
MPVNLSGSRDKGSGRSRCKATPRQIVQETLFQKYPTQNRTGGVAQVVEHLPSKCEKKRKEREK